MIKIYYTHNTFFVKGNPESIQQDIERVPEDRLRYIKRLSLTFSNEPGHHDDMFGVLHGGNNYIRKEKEPEWTKIQELIRCIETHFVAEKFTLEITVRMNTTIPAAIDHAVKMNLRTIFKRFWTLVKASKLSHVVVNFVQYDNMRPTGITMLTVLKSDMKGIFENRLRWWFEGDLH